MSIRSMARQLRRAAARITPPARPVVWAPAYQFGQRCPAPPAGRLVKLGAIMGPPDDPALEQKYEELRLRDKP